jgi:hypothetical protein
MVKCPKRVNWSVVCASSQVRQQVWLTLSETHATQKLIFPQWADSLSLRLISIMKKTVSHLGLIDLWIVLWLPLLERIGFIAFDQQAVNQPLIMTKRLNVSQNVDAHHHHNSSCAFQQQFISCNIITSLSQFCYIVSHSTPLLLDVWRK